MGKCCTDVSKMRHRVIIQSVSQVSDGQGGFTETWTDGATVWCSILPLRGFEKFQAMQMETPVTHEIVMRYRSDVTTFKRLKSGTRIFQITEALNVEERGWFLQIIAREMASADSSSSSFGQYDFSSADNSAYAAII